MTYTLQINKPRNSKPVPLQETLRCKRCPSRGSGSYGNDTDPHIACNISLEVSENLWIALAIAKKCQGPDWMREFLVKDFLEEGEQTAPPDS